MFLSNSITDSQLCVKQLNQLTNLQHFALQVAYADMMNNISEVIENELKNLNFFNGSKHLRVSYCFPMNNLKQLKMTKFKSTSG